MTTANSKQIGGSHYGGGSYQHWDWVCDCKIHYLPAAASKYVTRWRDKNGVEDLEKSLHYVEKAEEVGVTGAYANSRFLDFWTFALTNKLTMEEAMACFYLMEADWKAARLAISNLIADQNNDRTDDEGAGSGA